jgi:hypothetical protein
MKKIMFVFVAVALFAACSQNSNQTKENDSLANLDSAKVPQIALKDFDKEASKYIGKEVKISGIADHVCKHGGKRLFLVDNGADLHVESDTRFDDALMGSAVTIIGLVEELRVDEAYLLKMEEDGIKKHKGEEKSNENLEHKKQQIKEYRDSMKTANVDHLSFYSLKYVSHTVNK